MAMRLPKFEYLRPSTIEEASRFLSQNGSKASVVAGGTDLFPRMKYGLVCPEVIISLRDLPVKPPTLAENGELHLDSLMTLADVASSPLILERASLLSVAALNVASNEIRYMASLGGNLCLQSRCTYYNQSHAYQYIEPCFKRNGDRCYLIPKGKKCQAVFMADTVPALICLDARVEIQSDAEIRQIPVEKLYTGDPLSPLALSEGELIIRVIIPNPVMPRGTGFKKFSLRGGMEFGALTVAVLLDMNEHGTTCDKARIAVGSVSTRPVRALEAEAALIGENPSDELSREVAKKIGTEVHPLMHHGYSAPFLRECLEVLAFRTITLAAKKINQQPK